MSVLGSIKKIRSFWVVGWGGLGGVGLVVGVGTRDLKIGNRNPEIHIG